MGGGKAFALYIGVGTRVGIAEPVGRGHGLGQRLGGIVGDDAAFHGRPLLFERVRVGPTRLLGAGGRLHQQRGGMGRHPAGQEVRVSAVREQE